MEVVAALHAEGMSKRAIAAGIGVNDRTVRRDLEDSGAACAAPESDDVIEAEIVNDDEVEEERVTGLDGMKMTTRAIAAATGVSKSAVNRELSGVPFGTPAPDDDVIDAELVDDEEKRVIGLE